jgi:hypothetical protein
MSDIRDYFVSQEQKERKCSTCSTVVSLLLNTQCIECSRLYPTGANLKLPEYVYPTLCITDSCDNVAQSLFYGEGYCEEHYPCINCQYMLYNMRKDWSDGYLCNKCKYRSVNFSIPNKAKQP